jgi:hypothetical protein
MNDLRLEDAITAEELAAFLGITKTALAAIRDLPRIRIGNARLYFKQTVVAWLKAREGV